MAPDPRYARQSILPMIGVDGQARIAAAHVTIVGCGAIGCAVADHLARAGVGRLTIIDRDVVELSNLHRQILFDQQDAEQALPKAEAARRRLQAINSQVTVTPVVRDLDATNCEVLLADQGSILVDGTDSFETRYLVNDVAVKLQMPLVYAGVLGTHGMNMPILPNQTPCLRCVFRDPPPLGSQPTCESAGVLGPAVAAVGALAATSTLQMITGCQPRPVLGRFDLWTGERQELDLGQRDPDCPCCGMRQFESLNRVGASSAKLCGQSAIQVSPREVGALDMGMIAERLRSHGEFVSNAFLVRGKLAHEPGVVELTVFADGRAIVGGVETAEAARSIVARYVGC